jgi:hypothetical protein
MAKIEITRSWHVGKELVHAGTYRIPQDMSAERAEQAVKIGFGAMLPEAPKRGNSRKMPAPENKVLKAPEDKEQKPFPED